MYFLLRYLSTSCSKEVNSEHFDHKGLHQLKNRFVADEDFRGQKFYC